MYTHVYVQTDRFRYCLASEDLPAFVSKRVESFRKRLKENSDRLAYFLLFLRIFPMSPNWAINVSCGVLRVPVRTFFLTVMVGLMPYNFICVQVMKRDRRLQRYLLLKRALCPYRLA